MFNFLLFVIAIILFICTVSGIIAFFIDVHKFKTEINFSGTRKQLIEYLMFNDTDEDKKESEVIKNDDCN